VKLVPQVPSVDKLFKLAESTAPEQFPPVELFATMVFRRVVVLVDAVYVPLP
jgi:hypothetical protein